VVTTTILRGTEADTLELDGALAGAQVHVPAPLTCADSPMRVNILLFAMRGLTVRGVPWPRFDYHEALWRIAVELDGEPAWLATACDLDSPVIRALGRRIVRYPTRVARFAGRWSVEAAGGALAVELAETEHAPAAQPPRRTLVTDRGCVYEIPWQEIAAPVRRTARVALVTDTLSAITFESRATWSETGLVHRGRIHMCGVARRV
jgi:hypothetical protein